MPIVLTRATKLEARYKALGGAEHCSACRFYMPQGTCGRIIGPVSPEGWCKYYSREAVQRWSNPGYAGSGGGLPSGSTLNLNFMAPGTLPPNVTYTRAGTATYFDNTGTMQTATANTPRWDYDPVTHALRGMLIEETRTNLLLNSATLVTQSIAVTAQAYSLSFYGTGTVTLSGVSTAGPLVGFGAFPTRVSLGFTPTAGSLTLTITGSVLNAQLEAGAASTSWVPTAGTTAQRSIDALTLATAAWFNPAASSLMAEFMASQSPNTAANQRDVCTLWDGTIANRLTLRGLSIGAGAAQSTFLSTVASSTTTSGNLGVVTALAVSKLAAAWDGANPIGSLNGGATLGYAGAMPSGLNALIPGGSPGSPINGWMRRVVYWPRALSQAELMQATT